MIGYWGVYIGQRKSRSAGAAPDMLLPKLYVLLMLQDGDQGPVDRCFESSSSPTRLYH